uniref:Putative trna and rrna cytosine-c5-methylase nucleolar protein nol1/nop2 n=1 Tax=Culex tarsalis TaxID=7177 RepID=A0A1Q3EXB5_CULTA
MGRKINFEERPKKGPGRKARKQKDPVFDKNLLKGAEDDSEGKKLSHRQKVRAKKRNELKVKKQEQNKQAQQKKSKQKKEKAQKRKYESDEEEEDEGRGSPEVAVPERLPMNVQKSQAKYAKLAKAAKPVPLQQQVEEESEEEDDSDVDSDEGAEQQKRDIFDSEEEDDADDDSDDEPEAKVGKLKGFMEDSDDDSGEEDVDDDDDDDDDDALPIERAGKKLRKKQSENERLAQAELEDQMANKAPFEFPDENEQVTNIQDVHMRIKEVIGVLSDFSVNRDKNRSRSEYMDLLKKDLCLYYSYNEFFMELLRKLFSPNDLLEFLEASEVQRPLTIRTNSLKTRRRDLAQALINRGVNLDPIGKWSKEGLVVYSSQVPLGATPEYLAGHYMIQGASSMLPVMALAPEENERILDMCAAPGGKSSHIAALMRNTGVLFANDVNKDRLQAVVGNFHRLGIQNAIVTSVDGTKYREIMTGFDRVLLDAPCTGSGVISKDPSVKTTKTETDIQRCYNLQRKLLLTAIDCLSASSETGGYLVYSTCSILPQENEWVIDYALRKRNVKLVPTGLDFGAEGIVNFCGQKYHPSMKLTRRFYPHTFNMDGFFVAKLQKFSDAIPKSQPGDDDEEDEEEKESGIEDLGSDEQEQQLPKKIDKRDWYYKDIIEKRKKAREDPNHVVKVFEKPVKKEKKKQEEPKIVTPEQSPNPSKNQSSKKKKKQIEEVSTPVSTPLNSQPSTKKKKKLQTPSVEEPKTPQAESPQVAKSQSSMKKKKLKVDTEEQQHVVVTPKVSPVTPKVKSSAKKKKLKVEG